MPKPLLGLLLGLVLGFLDGLTALFYGPEVKAMMTSILVGSSMKSMIVGVVIGVVARKASLRTVLIVGTLLGFAMAFLVAAMPGENGEHYWLEIIVPGTLVGFILGYATHRYGRTPARAA
ncbi:MAG: hypothetical protein R3C71_13805 [Candidatus Krumholzibacteriia bacterium]|nr:hypothetical protein [bacterium]MCB9513922.1 hypothetical protein [Candidatus Latescibacterota bacterium]MCB9517077.1 hypothetical protein [Candidatus Latescibacterota bacterium]